MSRREVPPAPPGARSLKRAPALVELSRDHHAALVHALELRRAGDAADPASVRRCVRAYLAFAAAELRGHFDDEEAVVLPVADEVAPAEAARVRAEHREIEGLTRALAAGDEAGDAPRALCGELGELLHDHVRFEERALFESLQRRLGPEALARLGDDLEAHRRRRGRGPGCALP